MGKDPSEEWKYLTCPSQIPERDSRRVAGIRSQAPEETIPKFGLVPPSIIWALGFDDDELAQLLAIQDATEGLTDEDSVPEIQETPVSVAGDLWILGHHKLLVGDATVGSDVAKLMAGETADLVFTDLPYKGQRGKNPVTWAL